MPVDLYEQFETPGAQAAPSDLYSPEGGPADLYEMAPTGSFDMPAIDTQMPTQKPETFMEGVVKPTARTIVGETGQGAKDVATKAYLPETIGQAGAGLAIGMASFGADVYSRVASAAKQLTLKGEIDPDLMKEEGEKAAEQLAYEVTDPGAQAILQAIGSIPTGIKMIGHAPADLIEDTYPGRFPNLTAALRAGGDLGELAAFGKVFKMLKFKGKETPKMIAEKVELAKNQIGESRPVAETVAERTGHIIREREGPGGFKDFAEGTTPRSPFSPEAAAEQARLRTPALPEGQGFELRPGKPILRKPPKHKFGQDPKVSLRIGAERSKGGHLIKPGEVFDVGAKEPWEPPKVREIKMRDVAGQYQKAKTKAMHDRVLLGKEKPQKRKMDFTEPKPLKKKSKLADREIPKDRPLNPGERVSGNYMGQGDFTGTVESRRFHTIDHYKMEYTIQLDEPMDALGSKRNRVIVSIDTKTGKFESDSTLFLTDKQPQPGSKRRNIEFRIEEAEKTIAWHKERGTAQKKNLSYVDALKTKKKLKAERKALLNIEGLPKKPSKQAGPQGIKGRIKEMGGISFNPKDYNAAELRQHPEWKEAGMIRQKGGKPLDDAFESLKDEFNLESADQLVELGKEGKLKNYFTAEKRDMMLDRGVEKAEKELSDYYEDKAPPDEPAPRRPIPGVEIPDAAKAAKAAEDLGLTWEAYVPEEGYGAAQAGYLFSATEKTHPIFKGDTKKTSLTVKDLKDLPAKLQSRIETFKAKEPAQAKRAEFKAKHDKLRTEIKEATDKALKAAEGKDSIQFQSETTKYLVHKSTREPGKWQVTTVIMKGRLKGTPSGHYNFKSKENAIKSLMGNRVEGPAIGSHSIKLVPSKPQLTRPKAKAKEPWQTTKREATNKLIGVSQEQIDLYVPTEATYKLGREWGIKTVEGNSWPSTFKTKKAAIEQAKNHKQLSQDRFNNPEGYTDLIAEEARRNLKILEKKMSKGMSEMDAGRELPKGHKEIVKKALAEGKPVPPEVLKDYPDLKPPKKTPLDILKSEKGKGKPTPKDLAELDEIIGDVRLLKEEGDIIRAGAKKGNRVFVKLPKSDFPELQKGVFGEVVKTAKYPDGKLLIEHQLEGRKVKRFYDYTDIRPGKPTTTIPGFPKGKPLTAKRGKRRLKKLTYTDYGGGKELKASSYIEYKGYKIAKEHAGAYNIIDPSNKTVSIYAGPRGALDFIDTLTKQPPTTLDFMGFQQMYDALTRNLKASRTKKGKPLDVKKLDAGKVIKQRTWKSSITKEQITAPPVYEAEAAIVKGMKELPQKPLGGWIENPIRTFEQLGADAKELFYRPIKEAEHRLTLERAEVHKRVRKLRKGISFKSKKRIGAYGYGVQGKRGMALMQAGGVKKLPTLTPKEMKVYKALRAEYEVFYKRLNEARRLSGKETFGKVKNYQTFLRDLSILEEMGWNPITTKTSMIQKQFLHLKTTPFRFAKARAKTGIMPAEFDAIKIFETYTEPALRHIHLSPSIAKGREMLLTFGEKKAKTKWLLKEEKPRAAKFLAEWLDFQAGQRPVTNIPRIVEKGLFKLNQNIAFAVLSANIRSALIQPSALVQASILNGPKYTMKGIASLVNPRARNFAMEKSNVLKSRQYDVAITDAMQGIKAGRLGDVKKTIGKVGFKPLQLLDLETAKATWHGAYKLATEKLNYAEKRAVNYADDVVTKTQASAMPSDIAPIQRTALGKTLSLFQTFVINEWGFLTRDVLGIRNADINNKQVFKRVVGLIAATTLTNIFYEDVLGVNSPFPTPIRAYTEAIEQGKEMPSALGKAALELIEKIPIVGGGARYGSHPLGATVDLFGRTVQEVTGKKKPSLETGGKWLGVAGTAQAGKYLRAKKRGESTYGQIVGQYTKKRRGAASKGKGLGKSLGGGLGSNLGGL